MHRWLKRQFSRSLIAPWQVRSELKQFIDIVRSLALKTVVEIGRFRGDTLLVLAHAPHADATIVSMDLTPLGRIRSALLHTLAGKRHNIHLLTADSHSAETLTSVSSLAQALDLLFIDGDHSYAGVRRDFEMYAPLVRQGGMIAFHDIARHPPERRCEVSRFWAELKNSYKHLEIIANQQQGWAGIGVVYK
jgi:predicted O-methyltransferase YrrM